MNEKLKEETLTSLTNEQFKLSQLIEILEEKWRDTHYVEAKIDKIKKDINSLIR